MTPLADGYDQLFKIGDTIVVQAGRRARTGASMDRRANSNEIAACDARPAGPLDAGIARINEQLSELAGAIRHIEARLANVLTRGPAPLAAIAKSTPDTPSWHCGGSSPMAAELDGVLGRLRDECAYLHGVIGALEV